VTGGRPVQGEAAKELHAVRTFRRLVTGFTLAPLHDLENAWLHPEVAPVRGFDPDAVLGQLDAVVTGPGTRAQRLDRWSDAVAHNAQERLQADSRVRSWYAPAVAFLDPEAVTVRRRCPSCKQLRTVAPDGSSMAALWVTRDLSVCLSCNDVVDLMVAGNALERDGMFIRRTRPKARWARIQGDLDAAA
jgi:hypothetical protein